MSKNNAEGYNENPQEDIKNKEPELKIEPKIEARAERAYVSIPIEVTDKEWNKVDGLLVEIFQWLEQKGIQPNGAPFFRYWIIGDNNNKYKLEVGVPVANTTFGDDRISVGNIPEGKYAFFLHNGHPERINESFLTLEKWAENHGVIWDTCMEGTKEVWIGRFEYYLTDPAVQTNLEKWTIEIAFKIKEKVEKSSLKHNKTAH